MTLLIFLLPCLCYTQPDNDPVADSEPVAEATEKVPPESNYMFRQPSLAEPWEIEEPDAALSTRSIVIIGFLSLVGILIICRNVPDLVAALKTEFKPWVLTPATAMGLSAEIRAEGQDYSQFLAGFKAVPPETANAPALPEVYLLSEQAKLFFNEAPDRFGGMKMALQQIERTYDAESRQKALAKVSEEITALKDAAGCPELLPIWQMASTLEGLLKQLTQRANNFTSSTLRTVVNGVALLNDLCKPGIPADLLTSPPLRLLAVDDELISRRAVEYSLTKVLGKPDVAEDGQNGLALAAKQPYDIIFLDVLMPGMDGFELYSRIRKIELHRETPIVFVTSLNDFEARQSILNSGCDLIGKPFLTFEITLKAITLILKRRLQAFEEAEKKRKAAKESPALPAAEAAAANALATSKSVDPRIVSQYMDKLSPPTSPAEEKQDTAEQNGRTAPASETIAAVTTPAPELQKIDEATLLLERKFLELVSKELDALRRRIIEIFETPDNDSRIKMLGDFYLDFHVLLPKEHSAPFHPALRLCARLDALLKKLVEQPSNCTSSTLLTIHTALELIGELCAPDVQPSFTVDLPIRLLVVDDDPVARRAMTCALQIAFEKPETANDGESGVTLASQKPFDVIFMDIEMPGMDGFNACMKIHATNQNCNTPVVFVTSHNDFRSRTHAAASGGSDFIGKPFLTAEVTLKALTYALRGRLQKQKIAESGVQFPNGQHGALAQKPNDLKDKRRHGRKSKHRKHKSSSAKVARH